MAKLQLSLGVLANERCRAIIEGLQPEGIEFSVTVGKSAGEIFWRQLHFQEFDVSEMSLSELIMLAARGDRTWVVLPIFMTRRFFQTGILVRKDAGIEQPSDLRGKRIGVPEYIQTAGVWARGVLQDEFGVKPKDLQWYQERVPSMSHSTLFGLKDSGLFQHIPDNTTSGEMMVAGELDAVINYSGVPNLVDRSKVNLRQRSDMLPLFAKPRTEEQRYFKKTGIFQMNHSPAIKRSIVERHPWVALNIYQAFVASKKQAAARAHELMEVHASLGNLSSEAFAALDNDPFPYGVKSNLKALEALARYSYEQGLAPRLVDPKELFSETTLEF